MLEINDMFASHSIIDITYTEQMGNLQGIDNVILGAIKAGL